MALTNRLFRLFRADLHALLDRIESPERSLRQAIREMSEIVADDDRLLQALRRQRARVAARLGELSNGDGDPDVFTVPGDERLARPLDQSGSQVRRQAALLEKGLNELDGRIGELNDVVSERRVQLDAVRREAGLLSCRVVLAETLDRERSVNAAGPELSLLDGSEERNR